MASRDQEENSNYPQDSTLTFLDYCEDDDSDEQYLEDDDDFLEAEMSRRYGGLFESLSRDQSQFATVLDDGINHDLELLKNCKTIALQQVQGVDACPSVRACPTCGLKVEHEKTGCKNVICPCCRVAFCFVCLKLSRECMKTSSLFSVCSDGVAPRQTSIPVWHGH